MLVYASYGRFFSKFPMNTPVIFIWKSLPRIISKTVFHILTLNSPIVISKDLALGVPEGSVTVTKAVM